MRGELARRSIVTHEALERMRSGRRVEVAGLVLIRQRPGSAKGVIFMTIEDETGVANVIVWPKVFERFRPLVLGARFVAVKGRMQADHGVIHVVADVIEDLTPLLKPISEGVFDPNAALAPADHVKSPLRRPGGQARPAGGAPDLAETAEAAASLLAALSRADEVRRPVDEERGRHRIFARHARRAGTAEAAAQRVYPDAEMRRVLPKGRSFQ